MYCNQKLVIKWGRAYSKEMSIHNGVKQGGVISALFFCVYLDDLFYILNNQVMGVILVITSFVHLDMQTTLFCLVPPLLVSSIC